MLEPGEGLSLHGESAQKIRMDCAGAPNQLERDEPVEAFLPGQIDLSHAALTQFADDLVVPDVVAPDLSRGVGRLGLIIGG